MDSTRPLQTESPHLCKRNQEKAKTAPEGSQKTPNPAARSGVTGDGALEKGDQHKRHAQGLEPPSGTYPLLSSPSAAANEGGASDALNGGGGPCATVISLTRA